MGPGGWIHTMELGGMYSGCTSWGMHAVGSVLHGAGDCTPEFWGMHTTGMNAVGLGVRGCPPWGGCMPTLTASCGVAAEPPCLRELEKIQIQEATKKKLGEWDAPGPFPPAVPRAAGPG